MKQLIEKYKEKLKIAEDLEANYPIGTGKYYQYISANFYRTFIDELEKLEIRDAGKMANENGTKNC